MLYSLTLLITILLILLFKVQIKKYPWLFYIFTLIISLFFIIYHANTITDIVNKGYISLDLFVIVMFVGALNKKRKYVRQLLAIRGFLSISAFLFLIPHGIVQYLVYTSQVFTDWGIVIGLIASVVMIPLFITSFIIIRKHINVKDWKSLHKWSYFIYLTTFIHIILLASPTNQFLYTITFLLYTILRLHRSKFNVALKYTIYITVIVIAFIINKNYMFPTNQMTISSQQFNDGTFTGLASGYRGLSVSVRVSLKNNVITNIQVSNCGCTGYPFESFVNESANRVLNQQSLNVDVVSGATHSTDGLLQAINNALLKAKK